MSDDSAVFDKKRAAGYDRRIRWVIPGYDALHDLTLDVLASALPRAARVLVAGAGTGMELLTLGAAQPGWRFAAVDPSPDMLDVLNARVTDARIGARVAPHQCLVKDLPAAETAFDGATSLLVSHFIADQKERTAYFRSIADRLMPGAPLAFADYNGDRADAAFRRLFDAWKSRCLRSDLPKEELDGIFSRMEADVALIPESRLAEILCDSGFEAPALYWRGLVFGAWVTRRMDGRV